MFITYNYASHGAINNYFDDRSSSSKPKLVDVGKR